MQEVRVVSIDEEFEELQKSRVKAHVSKTKTGKLTRVKEYSRAARKPSTLLSMATMDIRELLAKPGKTSKQDVSETINFWRGEGLSTADLRTLKNRLKLGKLGEE